MLWYGAALPSLVSTAVLLASWSFRRHAGSIALALGLGCAVGQLGVEGIRAFPPREVADRLFYLLPAAVVLGILDIRRVWLRGALCGVLWLAVVWFVLPPALREKANLSALASWFFGLGLVGLLFWAMLALTSRRLPGATLPLILLIVAVGTVGVLSHGHSITLTRLTGVLAAALLSILIRSACGSPVVLATAPIMVLLPGVWLRSYFYDYKPPATASFLLLAAASLTGALGLLPGIRLLAAWRRCLLCAVAASLLAAAAVVLAPGASEGEKKPEEFLQINSRIGSAPSTT
jgi:hypothetical protein